jgi:hypothetical protein
VIEQDVTVNSNKDPRDVSKEDVVAPKLYAMEDNVSLEMQNATGLERDCVVERDNINAIGKQLEKQEDKRSAVLEKQRNAEELVKFSQDPQKEFVDTLDPREDYLVRDAATLLEDVLEQSVPEDAPSADSQDVLQERDVCSRNKEFVSNQRFHPKDSSVHSLLIHISSLLMERSSIKTRVEDMLS